MQIIKTNLFKEILIDPVTHNNVDTLSIVSGYATSAMAFHHLNHIRNYSNLSRLAIKVHLTVGMIPRDGISISNHKGFLQLVNEEFSGQFKCSYVHSVPQIHSKIYIWSRNSTPVCAYIGSANYTQTAMLIGKQGETVALCDPTSAFDYYSDIQANTVFCDHPDVGDLVNIASDNNYGRSISESDTQTDRYSGLKSATVSLVGRNGKIQSVAGLNWGQRPGRERNQAYLQLSHDVYRTDFFPIKSIHFTVLTDDNRTLICTRAQKDRNGQAIETPHNNSLLGEYFRNRLNIPNGAVVTEESLANYGRNYVTFYKIDDETFYMDFSRPMTNAIA